MKLFPKQQGSMWFRISVKGKSAHGGTKYEGVNAIEKSMKVIKKLEELETKRNRRITDPLYKNIPIPIPINIGKIHGGEWPSSVPDLAVLEGRMGIAPDETIEDAKKEMMACLEELAEKDSWFADYPLIVEWFGGRWLPGNLEADHPLISVISESFESVKKKNR